MSTHLFDPRNLGEKIERATALDAAVRPVHRAATAVLPRGRLKDTLHGVWLGHPLHPLLTDLPIGFWTSAWVLDLVGGRWARPAADAMVGFGVATALPTAAAGLADWSELGEPERRSGLVHATANVAATVLYGMSLVARLRGRRARGVALAMVGAGAATAGGFLGGHLSYRRAAGVNAAASAPMTAEWSEIHVDGTLNAESPSLGDLDGEAVAAVDTDEGPAALYGRCSHVGGPLYEGELLDGCLRCPWHGSTFRVSDGTVVKGPATATQPAYELRRDRGRLLARRRPPP